MTDTNIDLKKMTATLPTLDGDLYLDGPVDLVISLLQHVNGPGDLSVVGSVEVHEVGGTSNRAKAPYRMSINVGADVIVVEADDQEAAIRCLSLMGVDMRRLMNGSKDDGEVAQPEAFEEVEDRRGGKFGPEPSADTVEGETTTGDH